MVLYQAILWILTGFGALRMIILGIVGITLIIVSFLPSFPKSTLSESFLGSIVATCAVVAFLIAWLYVSRQRSGGAAGRGWISLLSDQLSNRMPRWKKPFRSPVGAQFWFEWRRGGLLLPLFIGRLLVLVIGPLSWYLRNEPGADLRILVTTLAMPMILALPVGKAFSKPDLWSSDLSVPSFVAVRPLATSELVIIKMKVAALSAVISWLLVFAFLLVRLPLGENFRWFAAVVIAGMFVTWRFLVGGLGVSLWRAERLLLVLVAILVVPLARIGFAPSALMKNRHR